MMDEKRLAEIEARCAAATPGPWVSIPTNFRWPKREDPIFDDSSVVHILPAENVERLPIATVDKGDDNHEPTRSLGRTDGEFIAHARTDVPDLVAEVRRLRTALAELNEMAQAGLKALVPGAGS